MLTAQLGAVLRENLAPATQPPTTVPRESNAAQGPILKVIHEDVNLLPPHCCVCLFLQHSKIQYTRICCSCVLLVSLQALLLDKKCSPIVV